MPTPSANRLQRWQLFTVVLLIVGYAGFYLCRSNLSVVMVPLGQELARQDNITYEAAKNSLGRIVSLGVLAYAIGKLIAGACSHWLPPRWLFSGRYAGVGRLHRTVLTLAGCHLSYPGLGWQPLLSIVRLAGPRRSGGALVSPQPSCPHHGHSFPQLSFW
ncbi:MAG: hypothetical protein QM703_21315 [Gemmatales bacterium]